MSHSYNPAILATGAALLAASVGLGYMTLSAAATSAASQEGQSENKGGMTEIDDDDDDDDGDENVDAKNRRSLVVSDPNSNNSNSNASSVITEQDVCQIFDKLFLEVQNAFAQLMNQIQQLQMTGQRIPDDQVQMIMRQELERALTLKQGAIVEMAGIDMDCLEQAVWEFMDPSNSSNNNDNNIPSSSSTSSNEQTTKTFSIKVKTSVERLQKLWQTATGEHVVGWRPGLEGTAMLQQQQPEPLLDPATTIAVAEAYFEAISDAMRQLIAHYKASGKDLQQPAVQQALNLEFAAAASEEGERALDAHGVTQNQFEESIKAHKNDANVTKSLALLQIKQGQDFAAMQG